MLFWDSYRPAVVKVVLPGMVKDGSTSFPYNYSCPKVFISTSIMVRMHPDNKSVKLDKNPLHSYEFQEGIMGANWDTLSLDVSQSATTVKKRNTYESQGLPIPA